jgi:prepilin-type N-terminal cleavage/methylation domain-containing protein
MNGNRSVRGFTLLELMIVIMIIGLTMSMVLFRVDGLTEKSRIRAAARMLGSTIDNVKTSAVAQGKSFYIDYDLDEHAYRIVLPVEEQDLQEWLEEEYTRLDWRYLPSGVSFKDICIANGEVWDRGVHYVGFSPLGTTDIGHIIHLVTGEEEEKYYSIEVNCVTGMVRFHDYYKEFYQIQSDE